MFWGGDRLARQLPQLISDFNVGRLDHASYRLRIGPEVYVSPTGEPDDPRNKPKTHLAEGQGFTIPGGQFGVILTEETVEVPIEAMAFISIRATYKFRGLVNVSGFHVDPNYKGRLIFSVFNAGPGPVHLSRGEPCFLIWFADLDEPSQVARKHGFDSIPSELMGPLASGLHSFASLSAKISENEKKIGERVSELKNEVGIVKWAAVLAAGVLASLAIKDCSSSHFSQQVKPPASTPSSPASSFGKPSGG